MIMDYNTIGFNQPVLYEGIHITCRSIFGYHYRAKKEEQAVDFVTAFVKEMNSTIRRNRIRLLMIDYGALIVEIPFAVCLLIFSPAVLDKENLNVLFIILTVVFAFVFIVLKFLNIIYLNRDLQAFLDNKKEGLTKVGFRALLMKARFNDRAPDVFLNLLLEKKDMGLSSPSFPGVLNDEDHTVSLRIGDENKRKKKECVILQSVPLMKKHSEEHPLQANDVEIQMNSEVEMIKKDEENFDDIEENKTQMGDQKVIRNIVDSARKDKN